MKKIGISKRHYIAIAMILVSFLLTIIKVQGQNFQNFTTTEGLPDNFVLGIAVDTNNVKWVATANGVGRYNDTAWTIFRTADGLVDNYVYCIAVDKNNQIWAGTDYGVSKFNGTTWTNYTTTDGLIDNNINNIYGAADGSVWFASQNGVSKYNLGTFTNYTTTEGLSSNAVSSISSDNAGNLWFCTQMGGVSKFNGTTFTNITKTTTDSLLDDNTFAIAFDHDNNRYIGTWYGITKLNSSDAWACNYRLEDGLYNNFVRDMKTDSEGNIWIGMFADYNFDGGISKFNGTSWVSYSVTDGLVNTQVTGLAIDKQNKPWISTGGGVSKLNANTGIEINSANPAVDVYPNPAKNVITINANNQDYKMTIVDVQGRLMAEQMLLPESNQISINGYTSGIYYIHLSNSKNSITKKIVVL
jgi:ligand-binding sensor domain-containing protein